jgi:Tfp pilus assembly protein PilF
MNESPAARDEAQRCYDAGAQSLAQLAFAPALAQFEEAVTHDPGLAEAHLGLARASHGLGDRARAESAARAALAADARLAPAAHFLGVMLVEQDRFVEALPYLMAAVELSPHVAQHQRDLAVTQLYLGDIGAARAGLLRTIELDVHAHEALYTLIRISQMDDSSAETGRLFRLVEDLAGRAAELPPPERARVLFALAKAYEDRRDFGQAARVMERGNALKRASFAFDIGAVEARLRRVAEVFDTPLLEKLAGKGAPSDRPIFIVGMPRSGSTLVEQILSSHPQVQGEGEARHLPSIVSGMISPRGRTYPEWMLTASDADCAALGWRYLDLLPAGQPGRTRTTDKRLENFEHAGLISAILPNAKIVHCRRDPRDQLFSCWSLLFANAQEWAYDIDELGRYHRAYATLMDHWRRVLAPGVMLDLRYEDLVADPEAGARHLLDHCGLEWDDQVLRFWEARRAVKSASMAQVREPIYDRSIGRWRPFAPYLAALFDGLELDAPPL